MINREEIIIDEYMVNIPLALYNNLLETKFNYKKVVKAFEVVLEKASLNWNCKELDFEETDMRDFIKQLALYQYNKRVEELNKEGEDNNE